MGTRRVTSWQGPQLSRRDLLKVAATAGGSATVWTVELLDNGNVFAIVHEPAADAPPFVFKGGVLMELDWDGNVVWQVADEHWHHDAKVLPNDNLLVLRTELAPGGLPNPEGSGMWGDWAAEITRDGETMWEWHASDHLEPEQYPLNASDQRNEWTHGNSIDQRPNGSVLLSFRNINTVIQVACEGGNVVWTLGPPTLAQ